MNLVTRRCYHQLTYVKNKRWQCAISGYGVPLPIRFYDILKEDIHLLRGSDFQDSHRPQNLAKYKKMVAGISQPIMFINDNVNTFDGLMLFLNPIEIHTTELLINNHIFGPYSNTERLSQDTLIDIKNLPPDNSFEHLDKLLSSIRINMKDEVKKAGYGQVFLRFPTDTPYRDWIKRYKTRSSSIKDYFGLYLVGIL